MRLSEFRSWPWSDQQAARDWCAWQRDRCPGCGGVWSQTTDDTLGITYIVDTEPCRRCEAIKAEQAHRANEAKFQASDTDGSHIVVREEWPDG